MTRPISETDNSAAVNPDHLLALFDPTADDPISQSVRDVLRALTANIRPWAAGQAWTIGEMAYDGSGNAVHYCIANIPASTATGSFSQDPPTENSRWRQITGYRSPWSSGLHVKKGEIVDDNNQFFLVRNDVRVSTTAPASDPNNFLHLGGSVEANPSGDATRILTKLGLNGIVYEVSGSGGEPIELHHDTSDPTHAVDTWRAVTLSQAPDSDSEISIKVANFTSNQIFGAQGLIEFSAKAWLDLNAITDTGADRSLEAGDNVFGFPIVEVGDNTLSDIRIGAVYIGRYSNTSMAVFFEHGANLRLTIVEDPSGGGSGSGTGSGPDLSDDPPEALGARNSGTSNEASRADHVHPTELLNDVIAPAMLIADNAAQRNAMRSRIGAGTSNITQANIDARVAELIDAIAFATDSNRWPKTKIPDDTVYTDDVVKFIASQIETGIANWGSGTDYPMFRIVRHAGATYMSIAETGNVNKEPGVASDWTTYWWRFGYADGAPGSFDDFSVTGNTLQLDRRDGTHKQQSLPSGGTHVAPNPAGTAGDSLDRVTIGTTDFNLPGFRPVLIGSADFGAGTTDQYGLHTSGDGIDRPATIADGEWWGATAGEAYGDQIYIFAASKMTGTTREATATAMKADDAHMALNQTRGFYLAFNAAGKVVAAPDNGNDHLNTVTLYRIGVGAAAGPVTHSPHISSFTLTSGEPGPVAGSIAGDSYGVSWAIAQSDNVGSARIIGFKGAFDASSVSVLATIAGGDYAHGQRTLAIPSGITLADNETYTLRIQVFDEGVTAPGPGTNPASYQDIIITAHAATTAGVHFGRVQRMANEAVADTVARINFANDDTTTGTELVATYTTDIPDDGNVYQIYWGVLSTIDQPTGFTLGGQPTDAAFNDPVDKTVGSSTFKVYLQNEAVALDHDAGDGLVYGVTTT